MHFLGSPEKHKFCPKWRIYFEELVDPFFTLIFLPAFPPEWQPWWLFAGTGVIFRQPNSLRGLFLFGEGFNVWGGAHTPLLTWRNSNTRSLSDESPWEVWNSRWTLATPFVFVTCLSFCHATMAGGGWRYPQPWATHRCRLPAGIFFTGPLTVEL